MRASTALALTTSIALGAPAARASEPVAEAAILADGTELVLLRIPGAADASLRYLVHSGGSADPRDKAGLAHLLEHTIFHGNHRIGEDELFRAARRAGARLNAFTSPEHTVYVLDAPKDRFPRVADALLQVVTSPALELANVDRERGVIEAEGILNPTTGMFWIVDQLLFPGVDGGGTLIGNERSRISTRREDLIEFYAAHYVPANSTVIVTGDLELEAARRLVEAASRAAPVTAPWHPTPLPSPNVPYVGEVRAPIVITVAGYQLDGVDRRTCREMASLLELRTLEAVVLQQALASEVQVFCASLRGHPFLLALAVNWTWDGGQLPRALEETFASLVDRRASEREREVITERSRRQVAQLVRDPSALADAAVELISASGRRADRASLARELLVPLSLRPEAVTRAAKVSLVPERRVSIRVAPL